MQPSVGGLDPLGPLRRGEVRVAAEVAQGGEEPPAREARAAAAQVAAGKARGDGRCGLEGSEELAVPNAQRGAGRGELAVGGSAHPLGEQRVLVQPARVEVLGEPDDPDLVEVETDRLGERGNEHALAEPADPGEGRLELDGEDLLEGEERGRQALGVEGGEPVERPLEDAEGVLLLERQPRSALLCEDVGEQLDRPLPEGLPVADERGTLEPVLELGDEGEKLLAGLGASLGVSAARLVLRRLGLPLEPLDVRLELGLPVRATDDPGLAGGPLEPGDAHTLAGEGGERDFAEGPHHVGATEAAARGLEESEEEAGGGALCDGADAGAVDGDVGGGQVLMEESGVGGGARVEDGEPVGRVLAEGGDDLAHDRADLVIRVGRREHPARGRAWARDRGRRGGAGGDHGVVDGSVGPTLPGEAGDNVKGRRGLGEGAQHPGLGPVEVLGEVEDEGAELVGGRSSCVQKARRGVEQVGGVVEAVDEPVARGLVEADDVRGQRGDPDELGEGHGVDVPERAVGAGERAGGRGVLGDGGEGAGIGIQAGADGGGGERRRGRAAAGAREDRPGELLGEVQQRGEPDGRDAATSRRQPAGEEPPSDDTGDVVRHQNGDLSHRVIPLGISHHPAQRLQRR